MTTSELHERLMDVCKTFGKDDDEIISALAQTLVRVIVEHAPIRLLAQAKIEAVAQVMRDAVQLAAGRQPPPGPKH
jgi:hypothetical protein